MRAATPEQQRGAVTLVGALFLIVVVIALLGIVQRMAASDISDTGLHNDGIEALFLAEAGLERTAWRYAGGTACAGLAGDTDSIGRGDFLVLASSLVGTLCQVRVEGRVTSTTVENTARRLLEGEFLLTVGFSGWAVGKGNKGNAGLAAWDGSSWTQPGPYPGVSDKDLYDLHCVTANDCWTVGEDDNGANINHWNGSSWTRIAAASLPDKKLFDIHCVATDDCWAVGEEDNGANISHWDGSSWTRVAAPAVPEEDLFSVSCLTSNDCWAVGKEDGSPNIIHWDGSSWTSAATPAKPKKDLLSVYCVVSDDCWAVGKQDKGENILHWDGSNWSRAGPYGGAPNKDLNSVHCVASDDCWAVGKQDKGENIIHWDGSSWSRFGPYSGIPNEDLNGIHMVSATEGYATGKDGLFAVWDGSTWSNQASPTGKDIFAIAFPDGGGGGGGVQLVRWTEVIQ
ncbi:MAG: hypothetical protein OEU44_00580 [Gammaproteobacteria bacterium]|nr:hypothetical protein [Gammaproteobacteria bacterium]